MKLYHGSTVDILQIELGKSKLSMLFIPHAFSRN